MEGNGPEEEELMGIEDESVDGSLRLATKGIAGCATGQGYN